MTEDQKAPRKQRHTGRRIYAQLQKERSSHSIAERTVRKFIQFWKLAHGEEADRFIAFRSHWQLDASFGKPFFSMGLARRFAESCAFTVRNLVMLSFLSHRKKSYPHDSFSLFRTPLPGSRDNAAR